MNSHYVIDFILSVKERKIAVTDIIYNKPDAVLPVHNNDSVAIKCRDFDFNNVDCLKDKVKPVKPNINLYKIHPIYNNNNKVNHTMSPSYCDMV